MQIKDIMFDEYGRPLIKGTFVKVHWPDIFMLNQNNKNAKRKKIIGFEKSTNGSGFVCLVRINRNLQRFDPGYLETLKLKNKVVELLYART